MKKQQAQMCVVCQQEPSQFNISDCNHNVCQRCLQQYLQEIQTSKKQLQSIKCCQTSCRQLIDLRKLLKYLQLPNCCGKCNQEKKYICQTCQLQEIEEKAKMNYYTKVLKPQLEDLIEIEEYESLSKKILKHDLQCSICATLNNKPTIICRNGHETCENCYQKLYNVQKVKICPYCKYELLSNPPLNLRTQSMISNLKIDCKQCKSTVDYQDFLSTHFRICQEQKQTCNQCQQKVEKQFYKMHIENFCVNTTPCPFNCGKKLNDHKMNFMIEHIIENIKGCDDVNKYLLRIPMFFKLLFVGQIVICRKCSQQNCWQVKINNELISFCFSCYSFLDK